MLDYQELLAIRSKELASVRSRYDRIAWSRLATVVLSCALVIVAWRFDGGRPAWFGALASALAFFILVFFHARLARLRSNAEAAVAWCQRGIDRARGRWGAFPDRGDRFADDDHPYALDLDVFGPSSLFQYLNDTRTALGARTLAAWLKQAAGASEIADRQAGVRELSSRHDLREALFVAGSHQGPLPDPDPLLRWTLGKPQAPVALGWRVWAWLSPTALIAVLIGSSLGTNPSWPAVVLFVLNAAVLALLRKRLEPLIEAIGRRAEELDRYGVVLGVFERARVESPVLRDLQQHCAGASRQIARLSRLVGWLDARQNGAFRAIFGPALLWDLHWSAAIEAWQRREGDAPHRWLASLATFEALVSLASFAAEHPSYAMPELRDTLAFEAEGLGHPLIDDPKRVVNDVVLTGPGSVLLVTGSNMSGKSTLLRSMGTAAVLAMAGAPVCARKLVIGHCAVRTSMRVSDSLRDGVSRFYAELLKLKRVVESSASEPVFFLLDEVLHGTNSRERHIGARSILRTLAARSAMGAVSTHDLALADLEQTLPGQVRMVHFQEQVVEGTMTFDYKLREGIVTSGNALRWMRHVGLEVDEP